jgi:hypothetical protein
MSNWIKCNPTNPIREGATNAFCITSLNVVPNESMNCKVQVQYQNSSLSVEFVNICQPEYSEWGTDDNWVYRKIASKLYLGTLANDNSPVTLAPATSYDDARSVHNEADIQKIQTLQEQLDAQAAKLKTITDMLIGKGLV